MHGVGNGQLASLTVLNRSRDEPLENEVGELVRVSWVELPLSDSISVAIGIVRDLRHCVEFVHRQQHDERAIAEIVPNESFHGLLRSITSVENIIQSRKWRRKTI